MKERFPQPGLLGCVASFAQMVSPSKPITRKIHMKITQRCEKSSCQILNMVFNHMDIDIDSDTPDRKKKNVTPRAVRRYVTMTFAQCDFQGRLPRLQTTVLEARPVVRNFAGHCVSVRRIFFDPYFAHPCDESFL